MKIEIKTKNVQCLEVGQFPRHAGAEQQLRLNMKFVSEATKFLSHFLDLIDV
jgi:hypothetical protein